MPCLEWTYHNICACNPHCGSIYPALPKEPLVGGMTAEGLEIRRLEARLEQLVIALHIAVEALNKYKFVTHDEHGLSESKYSVAAEALAKIEKMGMAR